MTDLPNAEIDEFMRGLERRNPNEPEFHQAVREVVETLMPFVLDHQKYRDAAILDRMTEPDRIITFRVCWQDDQGSVRTNRAWRVQFNNAIGPYKGGMRFHSSVNQSVLKFLGYEQVLKNSLTTLPMGGAKGGSNFNPKGKSDDEVMRFCHSLMVELHRHIGWNTDVPAGDIGVGAREIGYMFGKYRRLSNRFTGTFTGKQIQFGGSLIRTEATGYGCVYFLRNMLAQHGRSIDGKRVSVSGSGNVALYAIQKVTELGGKVVTASDSSGFVHVPDGINEEQFEFLRQLKEVRRGRITEFAERFGVEFHAGKRPWVVPAEIALPCATQNELSGDDAKTLCDNGLEAVSEGANMPCEASAVHRFHEAGVLFAPGKAANAGGVAVSGLEQSQNALRLSWTREEVDQKLQEIMRKIHATCVDHGKVAGRDVIDYVQGANIGGFLRVADAMLAYGIG